MFVTNAESVFINYINLYNLHCDNLIQRGVCDAKSE